METMPAAPVPPTTRPKMICFIDCPDPLLRSCQTIIEYEGRASLRDSRSESKKNVIREQDRLASINITQFAILTAKLVRVSDRPGAGTHNRLYCA
jgi:hypothetical protein